MAKVYQFRPICINYGCNKPVAYSRVDSNGNKRWRVHCKHCQTASYGGGAHAPGVTPFKTGRCSNQDGHLGFYCAIDYDQAAWAVGMTDVDHKNGNNTDNRISNLDELCPMCHKRKGKLAGDHNRWKKHRVA